MKKHIKFPVAFGFGLLLGHFIFEGSIGTCAIAFFSFILGFVSSLIEIEINDNDPSN